MQRVFTLGNWTFSIDRITARKTQSYGEDYSGICSLSIVNNTVHIEGLHCDEFTKSDYETLRDFAAQILGLSQIEYSRYDCNLNRKHIIKSVKK